jgi:hypothetical protein
VQSVANTDQQQNSQIVSDNDKTIDNATESKI